MSLPHCLGRSFVSQWDLATLFLSLQHAKYVSTNIVYLYMKRIFLGIIKSYKSRDDFVNAGLSNSKMNVVYPGIDLDHINSVSPSEKGFDGVYLGRLAISKGIP